MKSTRLESVRWRSHVAVSIHWLLFAQITTGCASWNPHIPLSTSRDELRRTANSIALAPVLGPQGLEFADSSLVEIDALIEETLSAAGFDCIPGREYLEIWERIVTQIGGIYDSESGELDETKFEIAQDQLRRDLLEMYQPDFLLYPEIWIVQAGFSEGVAKWDGVSQPVVGLGTRILNVIDAVLHQYDGFLESGITDAISLGIVVENMAGDEVLQNAGGIEVLRELEGDKTRDETMTFQRVLTDPERIQKSVRTALLPLLEARDGAPPSAASSEVLQGNEVIKSVRYYWHE